MARLATIQLQPSLWDQLLPSLWDRQSFRQRPERTLPSQQLAAARQALPSSSLLAQACQVSLEKPALRPSLRDRLFDDNASVVEAALLVAALLDPHLGHKLVPVLCGRVYGLLCSLLGGGLLPTALVTDATLVLPVRPIAKVHHLGLHVVEITDDFLKHLRVRHRSVSS